MGTPIERRRCRMQFRRFGGIQGAIMDQGPTLTSPTSSAATPQTEPEVLAGISSGEGQPAEFDFTVGERITLSNLMMVGGAAVLGLVASLGLSRYLNR
jgi:hypothetical protein